MISSAFHNKPLKLKPGGIFFLAPDGIIAGDQRHSLVEIKGVGSDLIVEPIPRAVLIRDATLIPVDGYHMTIHSNLMVHLKKGRDARSAIEVASAAITDGSLTSEVVHLATIGAAPPSSTTSHQGRFQKEYQGISAIIPVNEDDRYSRIASHLIIDIWATRRGFNCPGRLPAPWPDARPALTINGSSVTGPVDATWAFRSGTSPDAWFYFRHWFAEIPQLASTPFFLSSPLNRFSIDELLKRRSYAGQKWDIRGQPAHVTFNVGGYTISMTPAEARSLAHRLIDSEAIDNNGAPMVSIPISDRATAFIEAGEKERIIEFLYSAAAFAENNSQHSSE